jgi:hypothetical protein
MSSACPKVERNNTKQTMICMSGKVMSWLSRGNSADSCLLATSDAINSTFVLYLHRTIRLRKL